jgi:hypothetical protein
MDITMLRGSMTDYSQAINNAIADAGGSDDIKDSVSA